MDLWMVIQDGRPLRRALTRKQAEAHAAYLAKGRFLRDAANAPVTGDTAYGFVELIATP